MNISNFSSNSDNFKIDFFIKNNKNIQSQSPMQFFRDFQHGDDEKNHRKPKTLILYDDISERQKTSTSSQHLKKLTQKMTQSTESDYINDNHNSFYKIINDYYDYYNNYPTFRKLDDISQIPKSFNKIQRLYTEQTEIKKPLTIKQRMTQSQHQKKSFKLKTQQN